MNKSGQIICCLIIGISNALIRKFTFYTEAIIYVVPIENCCTPRLNKTVFQLRGMQLQKRTGKPPSLGK
ncbi:hypothetical protein EGM51_09045 [Verrucomicrobia bacterium S94]|nr:hypothetical protein EGM51_09045 [Verrucomicrobia bacterium S94]